VKLPRDRERRHQASEGVFGSLSQELLGREIIDSDKPPRSLCIRRDPVVAAEACRKVVDAHRVKAPPVPHRFADSSVMYGSRAGEHARQDR
jgi:hypothetical protein